MEPQSTMFIPSRVRTPRKFLPKPKHSNPPRARPTHFLAIPLNTNSALRARIAAFQDRLLARNVPKDAQIRGVDKSIIIDPRRFHFTLGVMSLSEEEDTDIPVVSSVAASIETVSTTDIFMASTSTDLVSIVQAASTTTTAESLATFSPPPPTRPRHTVASALALLQSLKPELDAILSDSSPANENGPVPGARGTGPNELRIVLDHLDILKPAKPPKPKKHSNLPYASNSSNQTTQAQSTQPMNGEPHPSDAGAGSSQDATITAATTVAEPSPEVHDRELWANVLHLAPREDGGQGQKLRQISDVVHDAFRRAGYVTEARGLTLHCTVLNTSKRKPSRARGEPFCYSDLLRSDALSLLGAPPAPPSACLSTPEHLSSSSLNPQPSAQIHGTRNRGRPTSSYAIPIDLDASLTSPHSSVPSMSVHVKEIGLWIMGSHGENNEYVSCGGVELGGAGAGDVRGDVEAVVMNEGSPYE